MLFIRTDEEEVSGLRAVGLVFENIVAVAVVNVPELELRVMMNAKDVRFLLLCAVEEGEQQSVRSL